MFFRSMILNKVRKTVVETLKQQGFSKKESVKCEKEIFEMCKRISDEENLLEEIYLEQSYEKVGELVYSKKNKKNKKEVMEDIKNDIIGWDSSVYQEYADSRIKDRESIIQKPKLQKGGFPCRKINCEGNKTKNTIWYQIQTRSGDEGMTTFVTCLRCGDRYSIG